MSSKSNHMQIIDVPLKDDTLFGNVLLKFTHKVYSAERRLIRLQNDIILLVFIKTEIRPNYWQYFAFHADLLQKPFFKKMFAFEDTSFKIFRPDIFYALDGCSRIKFEGLRCYIIGHDTRFVRMPDPKEKKEFGGYMPKALNDSMLPTDLFNNSPLEEVDLYYCADLKKTPLGEIKCIPSDNFRSYNRGVSLFNSSMALTELITTDGLAHFFSTEVKTLFRLLLGIRHIDLRIKGKSQFSNKSTVRLIGLKSYTIKLPQGPNLYGEPSSKAIKLNEVTNLTRAVIFSPSFLQSFPSFIDRRDPGLIEKFSEFEEAMKEDVLELRKISNWVDLTSFSEKHQNNQPSRVSEDPEIEMNECIPMNAPGYSTPKKKKVKSERETLRADPKDFMRLATTADSMSEDPESQKLAIPFNQSQTSEKKQMIGSISNQSHFVSTLLNTVNDKETEMPSVSQSENLARSSENEIIQENISFLAGRSLSFYFNSAYPK